MWNIVWGLIMIVGPAEPQEASDFPHAHGSAGAAPSLLQQVDNSTRTLRHDADRLGDQPADPPPKKSDDGWVVHRVMSEF